VRPCGTPCAGVVKRDPGRSPSEMRHQHGSTQCTSVWDAPRGHGGIFNSCQATCTASCFSGKGRSSRPWCKRPTTAQSLKHTHTLQGVSALLFYYKPSQGTLTLDKSYGQYLQLSQWSRTFCPSCAADTFTCNIPFLRGGDILSGTIFIPLVSQKTRPRAQCGVRTPVLVVMKGDPSNHWATVRRKKQ
jgi:hypothetical protein